jgi:hypothetical protein
MLNIPDELKNLYKTDQFPFTDEVTPNDLVIYFPELDLTIETDQIVDDSFELSESLCSESDLIFGSCEAAKIKFTVADVAEDLTGQWFTAHQEIDGYDPVPLGIFKVDSCIKQDNLRFKEITAYNILKDADKDVADWYNGLFPTGNETYTLKQFREALLTYLGIDFVSETLPNDSMTVEKTIEPSQFGGREVLKCCVELQGAFGQINRQGQFHHKRLLPAYGLYPAANLYPANDLYPVAENDKTYAHESIIDETVSQNMFGQNGIRHEEYTVKEIDKLIIRSEESDIGAIVGTGTNAYIIQGNFLVFGKSASELEQIALNAFGNMAKRPYRPYEANVIGLPYIEPGDTLQFDTDDSVTGYVLQRTLSGIQALRDEFKASGSEQREQNTSVNKEIIQLQGKTTKIKKDVEGVRVEVEDLAQETASKFEQTAESITQEVTRATEAEGTLSGSIETLAGQVVLKVDAAGNVAAVELDADPSEGTSVKIKANNIELEGLVTVNGNFKVLEDGTIEAVDGKFSGTINSSTIVSPDIVGGNITGATIVSTGQYGTVTIANGMVDAFVVFTSGLIASDSVQVGNIMLTGSIGNISCDTINGYTPITAYDVPSLTVGTANYAYNAGFATSSQYASYAEYGIVAWGLSVSGDATSKVYVSSNNNFRPVIDGTSSCGTSEGKWSSVWAINGTIQTSDQRLKEDISNIDERYLRFAKMILPRLFKMKQGTSGRTHAGFIAQEVEAAMQACNISDMEFAGLVKAPVYAKKLKDANGNELDEYDTSSEIIDYTYHLRYEEFIPLIFLWLRSLELD